MRSWLRHRLRPASEEDGFGLIELLMSLTIISISIAALLAIFGAGAFALARAGHTGTASAILDKEVEYLHRAPWQNIYLISADGASPSAAGRDYGETSAAGDSQYSSQCGALGCPGSYVAHASSVKVDSSAKTSIAAVSQAAKDAAFPPNIGDTILVPGSTCPAPSGSPGQSSYDSEAPPTWCAAEYDVRGPDNNLYRVYTYMKFGCIDGYTGATCPAYSGTTVQTDFRTKIVTIMVRLLKPDGTLQNSTSTGILAQTTVTLNYNEYVPQ